MNMKTNNSSSYLKNYLSTALLSDDGGVLWPLLLVDPLSD
jgi:hypothetical protein